MKYPPLAEGELDALVVACAMAIADHRGGRVTSILAPAERIASLVHEVRLYRGTVDRTTGEAIAEMNPHERAEEIIRLRTLLGSAQRVIGNQVRALDALRNTIADLQKERSDA